MKIMGVNKTNDYNHAINIAIDFIHQHLDDPLTLEQVASKAAFSPYHFHRIFKAIVQENVHDYVRRARIERAAKRLICHKEIKLSDIALECGFQSLATFSRAFKLMRGITPTDFRKRYAIFVDRDTTFAEQRFRQNISALAPFEHISGLERTISYAFTQLQNVSIQHLPTQSVAYKRLYGLKQGIDPEFSQTFTTLTQSLRHHRLLSKSAQAMRVSYDDPYLTPLDKCRYDACITVDTTNNSVKGIDTQTLPGGKYAVLSISDTVYMSTLLGDLLVQDWLPSSGYQLDMRPFLEKYTNNPLHDPYQRVMMDFCVPIRPNKNRLI
ncbi:AraC family transcriptional regulator [Paenibacillus sp. GSMTC-2017]|uniref:AraC family transcriptional regulator n=1 Tax=Paenibacillus sp. GSMTC-2017 TaxID=2794350 RepID=UPI0018D7E04F|nr:GyrI-like domain-containing protein [Paenibacillus sp. GSMTC-2017]MBH5319590.1 AraC family transcriptional regulator [Paenibacillus sp. GSMTC-2017]